MSEFKNDGASVMIGNEKAALKLKRGNPKIISILCDNHRLALAILLKIHFLQIIII